MTCTFKCMISGHDTRASVQLYYLKANRDVSGLSACSNAQGVKPEVLWFELLGRPISFDLFMISFLQVINDEGGLYSMAVWGSSLI